MIASPVFLGLPSSPVPNHDSCLGPGHPKAAILNARRGFAGLVMAWMLAAPPAHGDPAPPPLRPPTLWVIQGDDAVPYDLTEFRPGTPVRVPHEAAVYPEQLAINRRGQMMLPGGDGTVWLWNGKGATTVRAAPDDPINPPAPEAANRSWVLGDDGASLFVVETFAARGRPGANNIRVLHTGLDRRCKRLLLSYVQLPCQYSEEPAGVFRCPAATLWAPGGVASDFMVLTRWYQDWSDDVPEPDSSDRDLSEPRADWPYGSCHQVVIRQNAGGDWAEDVDRNASTLLDAMTRGSVLLQRDETVEMNGYENGCDSVRLGSRDTSVTLSNTCGTFPTQNYDVGFTTTRGLLSPGGRRVALTLVGSAAPDGKLPLRAGGHADTLELRSLRRALSEMPVTEAYERGASQAPVRRILHAELVGWSSDREVLLLERGRIVAVDVVTGKRRESSILASSAALARVVR